MANKNYDVTALYFPQRLTGALELIASYPMSIVEAPSGFGKTTAVRGFLRGRTGEGIPVHWHTFVGEGFPAAWDGLCKLISRADPYCGQRLLEMRAADEEAMPLIAEIMEDLDCGKEMYLVLDNFQDAKIPFTRFLLEAFARHGGEGLHFVVLTQQLPPSGTLLGQNRQVYRISADTLTFSQEDTAAYYRKVGLRVGQKQLHSVYSRCEGWVAALYLQMLAYIQTGSFENGDTERLLQTALWNRLSTEDQAALLRLSLPPNFTLAQAKNVAAPAPLNEAMLRDNPFIRFDRESRYYYMHSILKDWLFLRFESMTEAFQREAWLEGGDWYAGQKRYMEAMRCYHRAGAYENIFALPLTSIDVADHAIGDNVRPVIFDLLDNTERKVKLRYPQSMINIAFALFFMGEHPRLMALQGEIADIIRHCALSEKGKMRLAGEMELLMSFLEYNRIDKMSEKHLKALELMGGPTSLININSTWTFGSPSILYMYYRESGKLKEELAQMDECMPHYYRLSGGHGSGAEIVMHGEAAFNAGQVSEAETLCHKAMFVADSKGQNSIYQCALFLLARIAIQRGDMENLRATRGTLRERAKHNREDLCRYTIDLCEGFIDLLLGEEEKLPQWLAQGETSALERHYSMMAIPFAHIICGRAMLARGEYQRLLGAGAYFLEAASIFSNLLSQIYVKIYMAQANAALGMEGEALGLLADALRTAAPDALYMPFAENGEKILPLLRRAAGDIGEQDALVRIEGLSRELSASLQKLGASRPSLTEREQEVCRLIAGGLTNKQIAERLYISISTVKTLVSRILEKTDAVSRTQLAGQKW